MITTYVHAGHSPSVVAVFSYRYDAHLVPALEENLAPLVDGWIGYDDRASSELFSDEIRRRTLLLRAACDLGAEWALAVDPDERFERRLAAAMPRLMRHLPGTVHTFRLRELYAPDRYRVDGMWGRKRQGRLLSLARGVVEPVGELHVPWHAWIPSARLHHTRLDLYHLKMITRARRAARAALYCRLDPDLAMQARGYDYLADDRGARFRRIGSRHGYDPPHLDDGGLWMADPSQP